MATGETIVFWLEENTLQSQFGLQAQKLSAAGTRLWGSGGVTLIPVSGTPLLPPRSVAHAGGAMVFLLDGPAPTTDRLIGLRVDPNGSSVWFPSRLVVSSAPGGPGRIVDQRIVKSGPAPGDLTLTWGASCSAGALDYGIYEGQLGSFDSHSMIDCSDDGGDLQEPVATAVGDRYYLVVPLGGAFEGSYGVASDGAERSPPPSALGRCLADQALGVCPP